MSREIDLSKPLSDEDAQYLADRGRYADLERAGRNASDLPDGDGTGPQLESAVTGDRAASERDRLIARLRELDPDAASDFEGDPETDDEEVAPYSEWTVPELDAELKRRELPGGGNKAEKVKRLEDDDAASAES